MNFVISAPAPVAVADAVADAEANDNQIIHLINDVLKREIIKETKNESLEIGDKIKDGAFSLQIATFKPGQLFPVTFKPDVGQDDLKDVKIVALEGSLTGSDSSEFVIKNDDHHSSSTTVTTTLSPTTTTVATEHKKLLKEIAAEPVILTQH